MGKRIVLTETQVSERIANLSDTFYQATPSEMLEGQTWYPRAMARIADIAKSYSFKPSVVAGIVALLSPMNKWETNLDDAATVIENAIQGADVESFKVSTFNSNKHKAWRVACFDSNVLDELSGPKVSSFYRNLMGSTQDVTMDTHAFNAWLGYRNNQSIPMSLHMACVAGYQSAARAANMEPRDFQATVWIVQRRIAIRS
jgi:hypothetical protein